MVSSGAGQHFLSACVKYCVRPAQRAARLFPTVRRSMPRWPRWADIQSDSEDESGLSLWTSSVPLARAGVSAARSVEAEPLARAGVGARGQPRRKAVLTPAADCVRAAGRDGGPSGSTEPPARAGVKASLVPRRRVHFGEDPEVREYVPESPEHSDESSEEDEARRAHRLRWRYFDGRWWRRPLGSGPMQGGSDVPPSRNPLRTLHNKRKKLRKQRRWVREQIHDDSDSDVPPWPPKRPRRAHIDGDDL